MWLAARHLQIFHILLLYDGLVLPRRHACPHDAASSGRTLIVRTRRPHDATQHRWTRRPDDAPPRREDIMNRPQGQTRIGLGFGLTKRQLIT